METKNIQFNYYYRDAGNYKTYRSIVFSNNDSLNLDLIEERITKALIDGEYFIPQKWNVPLINVYAYDSELDHDWYTFEGVEFSEEANSFEIDIYDFLRDISK